MKNVFLKAKSQSDGAVKTRLRQVDRAWLYGARELRDQRPLTAAQPLL